MFTTDAKALLPRAQNIARTCGRAEIDAELLLVALLRSRPTNASRLLTELGVDGDAALHELEHRVVATRRSPVTGHVPMSADTKVVISDAIAVSRRRGDKAVGTQHVLLVIVGRPDIAAARVLDPDHSLAKRIFAVPTTKVRDCERVASRLAAARARWQVRNLVVTG
jgi:ATP-dependent Clp protease ATP-binding subunit ClpA